MSVEKWVCFAKTGGGKVIMPSDFTRVYPQCTHSFEGVNYYYGINPENVANFVAQGERTALQDKHRDFFEDVFQELETRERFCIVLGLQPPKQAEAYDYVEDHLDLVEKLAEELAGFQAAAEEKEQTLDIIVRFASEMNVPTAENPYAGFPAEYKAAYRIVRQIFLTLAPNVRFCFSPALRSDIKVISINQYWPGDDVVDMVAGTWYIGATSNADEAITRFKTYCRTFRGKGKPFGIDELGGCNTVIKNGIKHGEDGDKLLKRMRDVVMALGEESIAFEYATLFLEGKWGESPNLSWF